MVIGQKGIDLIKSFEGLRLVAYKDVGGLLTIGYGHTKGVYLGQEITEARAEALLRLDVQDSEAAIKKALRPSVFASLGRNEFDALVSFVFNVGGYAFANSTMLRLINEGASPDVIANEFGRWVKVGSDTVNGLVIRRKAEAELYLSENSDMVAGLVAVVTASIIAYFASKKV
jgi:lysozyme